MNHRRVVLLGWAIVIAFAAFLPVAAAQAREGFLDRSFGVGGRFVVPAPFEGASLLREEDDGSLIVSGEGTIGRFGADGSFDTTFGEGGRLTVPNEIEGLDFSWFNREFDRKGRMLVFGTASEPPGSSAAPVQTFSGGFLHSIRRTWAVVLRYTQAGRLDPNFGEGKGFVRSDFGATPVPPGSGQKERQEFQIPGATALDLAVDLADRPVLLVGHEATRSPCFGKGGFEWRPFAVVRLTEEGLLDTTFGADGLRPVEGVNSYPGPRLVLDPAGPVSVAGAEGSGCPDAGLILTLNQDGAPFGGVAGSGYTRFPGRYFAGLAPDGAMIFRHLLVGLGALSRTWPDGRPDRKFGRVRVASPPGSQVRMEELLIDDQGRILLGCAFTLPPGEGKPRRTFIAIFRLRRDGETDLEFGKQGWIRTAVPVGSFLGQFVLDAAGRLLVSTGRRSDGTPAKLTFLRYVLNQQVVPEQAP